MLIIGNKNTILCRFSLHKVCYFTIYINLMGCDMEYFLYVLFGALGGLIGGMGMGGGTILIPLLTLFLHVPQLQAQTINLISFIPMAIVSLIIHIKNKLVDFKALFKVLPFALGFSILSSFFALKINSGVLRTIFGVFMLIIGGIFMLKTIKNYLFKFLSSHKSANIITKIKLLVKQK